MYEPPAIMNAEASPTLQENSWVGPLLVFVLVVYGSAWAFCQASCGWGRVRKCDTGWFPPHVMVECR